MARGKLRVVEPEEEGEPLSELARICSLLVSMAARITALEKADDDLLDIVKGHQSAIATQNAALDVLIDAATGNVLARVQGPGQ